MTLFANCKKYLAEMVGTVILVVFGCGVAVATGVEGPAGLLATALAFGLVIAALSYAIGHISGCHLNPAVTLAMWMMKRISMKDAVLYMIAQIIGGIVGAAGVALFFGTFTFLGANQVQPVLSYEYGDGAALAVALVVEIFLTFAFVLAVIGVAEKTENKGVTGIVIGIALTLAHLLGIRLTGTSVNPARSIGPALLTIASNNTTPISQIWIFIIGPLVGAALAVAIYKLLKPMDEHRLEENRY